MCHSLSSNTAFFGRCSVTVEIIGETNLDDLEPIGTPLGDPRESNGRPSRVRCLSAHFDEDEVYELPQRIQLPRFTESALPVHSRAEYSTVEKRPASKISQKSTLPADHRT
ncbi:hypothetical protein FOMG_19750 [Fusarium oxysporum f. sp. melonis 26406]|uniref:Uncharacterized protein n=1 Tax=Fusarium oxysporum f. sp. melonis 26406 TaxID=1089452 RepID=W9ZQS5_FUSOX|nr:hypothetical protein FOMG_19750 [Fusarium oxysporum f. sp. melonis 26406]